MHFPRSAIITLATLVAAAGCRCPSSCCLPATPHLPCDSDLAPGDATPPDLLLLIPECGPSNCGLQALPTPGALYHPLTPEDCQCRAAANANVANMLLLEEHWATVTIECDSRFVARNYCLLRDLFELHATDLRNKAAASALETYYQLAGLEIRSRHLEMAIDEARQSLNRAANIQTAGLAMAVDREEASVQLHALEDRRVQLQLARIQLNGHLQKLMGCQISESDFFWPQFDWQPDFTTLDPEAELQAALPNRLDLRGVGILLCQLEKGTLRVARAALQAMDGSLGSVEPTEGWVHRLRCIACSDHEVDVRCRQLALLYADIEQLAAAEIKGAVFETVAQQHRVTLAAQAVADRRKGLYELSAKRDIDDVQILEISRARGRLFDAEAALVEQLVGLKVAEVRLKRAEAALAAECGFNPQLCDNGCCDGACTRCLAPTCRPGAGPCPCEKCRRVQK